MSVSARSRRPGRRRVVIRQEQRSMPEPEMPGATTLASGILAPGEYNINLGTSGWVAAVSNQKDGE